MNAARVAIAIALTISGHLPILNAASGGRCSPGATLCGDLAELELYGAAQSSSYLACEPFMRGAGFASDSGARVLERMRLEAAPRLLARVPLEASAAGSAFSLTTPGGAWLVWYVSTRDTAGNESCRAAVAP